MNPEIVGRRIMLSRLDLGITQEELARRTGFSPGWVNRAEKGNSSNPKVASIETLADVLDVHPGYLFGYIDDPLAGRNAGAMIHDSHVIYEVERHEDRSKVQRLLDAYLALSDGMQDTVLNMVVESQRAQDLLMRDIGMELIELLTDEETRDAMDDALHLSQSNPTAAREVVLALFGQKQ